MKSPIADLSALVSRRCYRGVPEAARARNPHAAKEPGYLWPGEQATFRAWREKGKPMDDQFLNDVVSEDELLIVEIGDAVNLTEGQGAGHSEDKRRAYN